MVSENLKIVFAKIVFILCSNKTIITFANVTINDKINVYIIKYTKNVC